MTWAEILKDAYIEIGVVDPIDTVPAELQTLALVRLNSLLNTWNAEQAATYNVTFPTFTLTPSLSPHTIGPSGATVTATQRPVAIIGANLQIGSGANLVNVPIAIRDDAWWLRQPVPNITSGIPTDLYYSPDWPNGSMYFWPIPTVAYGIQLEVRYVLANVAQADLSTSFSMPPGYQAAITKSLAEDLVTPMTVVMPPELPAKARDARAICFANNSGPVRIQTRQSGMPGGNTLGSAFNWRSRTGGGAHY